MGEAWPKDAQNERFKSSRGEKASESVILRTQMKTLDAERRAILSAYDADRLQTDLVHSPFDGIRNCYSTFIHFQGTSKLKTSFKDHTQLCMWSIVEYIQHGMIIMMNF